MDFLCVMVKSSQTRHFVCFPAITLGTLDQFGLAEMHRKAMILLWRSSVLLFPLK